MTHPQVTRMRVHRSKVYVGRYNPRTYVDPALLMELAESIKAQGILQAPIARPMTVDGVEMFEIAAGQRRFLAAELALGEDSEIDLDVRPMTDDEAIVVAATENFQREGMNPAEEARAAAKVLATANGDHAEAARLLGWKLPQFKQRIRLMACSDRVLDGIAAKTLSLGLAELLAGLTRSQQDKCLDDFAKDGAPSIEDFKKQIQVLSKGLNAAIFDKSECASCRHNSQIQASMFDTHIGDGHCTNAICYDGKTETALQAKVDALKDDYQVVRILRPGENFSVAPVVPDGDNGVGEKQVAACQGCANYGAIVAGVPERMGAVRGGICFNVSCNQDMVSKRQSDLREAREAEEAARQPPEQAAEITAKKEVVQQAKTLIEKKGPKASGSGKTGDEGATPEATVLTLTNAVREYRDKLYRTVITLELAQDPFRGHCLLLALASASRLQSIPSEKVSDSLHKATGGKKSAYTLGEYFQQAEKISADVLAKVVSRLSVLCTESLTSAELEKVVSVLKVDWKQRFTLDEFFLNVLTKAEMISVARTVGLIEKLKGETHKSLMALKKEELVKKLLEQTDFDYAGAMPDVLKPGFSKT